MLQAITNPASALAEDKTCAYLHSHPGGRWKGEGVVTEGCVDKNCGGSNFSAVSILFHKSTAVCGLY